jgi:hypothetical protein
LPIAQKEEPVFTLRKLWDALGRLADSVLNLSATVDAVSAEPSARCGLPAPAPAPPAQLPAPVPLPAQVDGEPEPAGHGKGGRKAK